MNIVAMDALEYIEKFDDCFFDLIILDPNYQDWDRFIKKGIIEKCIKKIKPSGNILCFTKQPFDFLLRNAVQPYFRREIIWTFENGGAWVSPKMPLVSTQKIYWIVKNNEFYFNPRTGVDYSENTRDFKRSTKIWEGFEAEGKNFTKSEEGVWLRDHLHYNKPNYGNIPAKPKELIEIFLKCFCPPNGVVLDAFTGSGVVPFLCEEMNLSSYACDIDHKRVDDILNGKCFFETKAKNIFSESKTNKKELQMTIFDFLGE